MTVIDAPTNGTNTFLELFQYVNETTNVTGVGGLFGVGIILVSFFGIYLLTKAFSYERSFIAASFVTAILAVFLKILDLISDGVLYFCIIIFVISMFFLMSERSNEGLG